MKTLAVSLTDKGELAQALKSRGRMRGDRGHDRDIGARLLMTHRCLGEGVWTAAKGGTLSLAEWTEQMG